MMKSSTDLSGVLAIPVTPFDNQGKIDVGALAEVTECFLSHGANAIVGPVFVSEFYTLESVEREVFLATVSDVIDGRVPLIAGVSAPSKTQVLDLSKMAMEFGASALLAMPPYIRTTGINEVTEIFEGIAAIAPGVPLMIQNAPQPAGVQMTSGQMEQIIRAIDGPVWVKEETANAPQIFQELIALNIPNFGGAIGGVGGRYLIEEFIRGGLGTMPSGEFIDMHVKLWDSLTKLGPLHDTTIRQFNALLPLLILEGQYGIAFCKEVLALRGLGIGATTREPNSGKLDSNTIQVLKRHLEIAVEVFGVSHDLV